MVELVPTDLSEQKALQRKKVEYEQQIDECKRKLAENEAAIARKFEELQIVELKMVMRLKRTACLFSLICLLVLIPPCFSNVFGRVATEFGDDAYAETPVWFNELQPWWLRMPANTLVNVGYIFVGLLWLTKRLPKTLSLAQSSDNKKREIELMSFFLKASFCWSSVWYGFVQGSRLFWQIHPLCVLDQWVTLPIFALAGLLCYNLDRGPVPITLQFGCTCLSLLSYLLTLISTYGFEIALGLHTLLVVWVALKLCLSLEDKKCWKYFYLAFLCCLGFIVLKLLDFHFISVSHVFRYFSGHFWSKICDILQIHYTLLFIDACQWRVCEKVRNE